METINVVVDDDISYASFEGGILVEEINKEEPVVKTNEEL